ncbi:DUF4334 domain-containing protein [Variovorax dokdonensis]|uniref:DUF4334 domain-containing protein n=1 Tax=Variovorax dokdonensis TaxID=344883 RepID=A0ABT7N9A5_9BURK|nr:DUF4334 domain-containing protein [Variovorax dokdonensis]MDM0044455.1 DUF4334 domain-containing protein [Variovorax dokdonensis]
MSYDLSQPLSPAEALALFDRLEPVDCAFMFGRWRGSGVLTGHPMDGLLEAYRWWGKHFESTEVVHPLLFEARNGQPVAINPALLGAGLGLVGRVPLPRSAAAGRVFQTLAGVPGLLRTSRPRARLRMLVHRGQCSAAMVYDQWPIIDVFRRVDEARVLGLMDARDMAQPFFFQLTRDRP